MSKPPLIGAESRTPANRLAIRQNPEPIDTPSTLVIRDCNLPEGCSVQLSIKPGGAGGRGFALTIITNVAKQIGAAGTPNGLTLTKDVK